MAARHSPIVEVDKIKGVGCLPSYIPLILKRLEKEQTVGVKVGKSVEYTIPVDLVELSLPAEELGKIREVIFAFGKD